MSEDKNDSIKQAANDKEGSKNIECWLCMIIQISIIQLLPLKF